MVRVEPLQASHMPDVLRIQAQCYTEIVPESATSLHAKLAASPRTCFVAEGGDAVLGYLISAPIRFPQLPPLDAPAFDLSPDADALYLHDLAIAEDGRGTGAGQLLVRCVLDAARAQGLHAACLVAIQGSAAYWQRFGFTRVAPPDGAVAAKLASYGTGAQLMTAQL